MGGRTPSFSSECAQGSTDPIRMAKVFYRRRPCDLPAPGCHLVGVPGASLEAVSLCLEHWASTLPPSQTQSPIKVQPGGEASSPHEMGPWRTSLLPLPPRDALE